MGVVLDQTVRVNSGFAWEMKKGQRVRLGYQSIIDFVVFNLHNLSERFDQARTKANQGKIFLSTGDLLLSKLNTPMMTIIEDNFKGTHDLQYGMCSGTSYSSRWERRNTSPWKEYFAECGVTQREDLPLWGCYENIMTSLQNYAIIPLDIPAPFNIGQHMTYDDKGKMRYAVADMHRELFDPTTHMELRAEIDCLCALSCDPGMGKLGAHKGFFSKPIHVELFSD